VTSETTEIRFYKGKTPCEIITKSKKNYLVRTLTTPQKEFTTVPRLLWRKPKHHKPITEEPSGWQNQHGEWHWFSSKEAS